MRVVPVQTASAAYDIHIGSGILQDPQRLVTALPGWERISELLVVSNETVHPLYGEALARSLSDMGRPVHTYVMPDGEEFKTWQQAEALLTSALEQRLSRRTLLLAVGGGVVGDLAGFAASVLLRGIPYVQVPTTLLAQVDSSVGGKVAVNHRLGKNLIGAFYQPQAVWADLQVFRTLPVREWQAGMAEVIKYGVLWEREFFDYLAAHTDGLHARDAEVLEYVIGCSCAIKAAVVREDEQERGLRAVLNFGHTVGHALERATAYRRYRHGEAVAVGMVAACRLGEEYGVFSPADTEAVVQLLEAFSLPTMLPADISIEAVLEGIGHDKKTVGSNITFILPEAVGKVRIVDNTAPETIAAALRRMGG